MAKLTGKAKAAFLRRMAKGRNKGKRRAKRAHKGAAVAKRRGHKRHHHIRRAVRHVRRHARRASNGISKYLPKTEPIVSLATAYAYGKVDKGPEADNFLAKVPAVVPALGRAGNVGALLWVAGVVTRQSTLKAVALGALHVAAYQHGSGATFTKEQQGFKMSGPSRASRDEQLVENYLRSQR